MNKIINRQGSVALIVLILVVVILIAGGIWYYEMHQPTSYQPSVVPTSTTAQPIAQVGSNPNPTQSSTNQQTAITNCGSVSDADASYIMFGIPPGVTPTAAEKASVKCFDSALANCQAATLTDVKGSQTSVDTIKGQNGANCTFSSLDFTGISKTCEVPQSAITAMSAETAQQGIMGLSLSLAAQIDSHAINGVSITDQNGNPIKLTCTTP